MKTLRGLRWWMMGLLMVGSIINYLTRSTLAVAAPKVLKDLDITTEHYSWMKRYGRSSALGAAGASLRDFHNYLVTSATVEGEWSDPVYLNSSGFDPSLFHDDDGRKYLVNMLWDHRAGQNGLRGSCCRNIRRRSSG
jgi:hypothetical protein